jgi:hypothetical protein
MPSQLSPDPVVPVAGGQTRPSRRMRPGILAGIAVLAGLATSVVADQQGRRGLPDILPGIHAGARREANLASALVNVAGFRQRGNLLIGEVRATDGTPIRLVLDGRTQALVGFRVLARDAVPDNVHACRAAGIEAPAPRTR